jgi:putative intracellular protease/amidase
MKEVVTYGKSSNTDFMEIVDSVRQGKKIICSVCGAKLSIALTQEEAKEKKLPLGIFCPTNQEHVAVIIQTDRRDFWKRVEGMADIT